MSDRRALALVLLVALAARLGVFSELAGFPLFDGPAADTLEYLGRARAILAGDPLGGPGVFFHSSPLYAWLMAAALATGLADPAHLGGLVAVQLLVGVGTAGLSWALARRLAGPGAALAAGLLVALSPTAIFYDAALLGDFLLPPAFAAAALLLARPATPRRLAATGAVLGLAALVRPNALLLLLPAAWAGRAAGRRGLLALAAAAGLAVAPATVRNAVVADDLVVVSSNGGVNFWIGNNPAATGAFAPPADGDPRWASHLEASSRRAAEAEAGRPLRPSEVSRHFARKAAAWILRNPGDWLRLVGRRLRLLGAAYEIPNHMDFSFVARRSFLLRWLPARWWLVFPLGLAGMLLGRRRPEARAAAGMVAVYLGSVVLLFFVTGRYRHPVFPLLAALGAAAPGWLVEAWRSGARRRAVVAAGVGLAALGLAAWPAPAGVRVGPAYSWHHLARVHELRGEAGAAVEAWERAVEAEPGNSFLWNGLGVARARVGDDAGAVAALERATVLAPDDPEARANLALALARAGRAEAAARAVREATALDPADPAVLATCAAALHLAGDPDGAALLARRLTRLAPELPAGWLRLAAALEDAGRGDEALAAWREALARKAVAPDTARQHIARLEGGR